LAEQLIRRAKSYVLVGEKVYMQGASSRVPMKCVPKQESKDILEEIHKCVCGNHASSRTHVSKAFRRAFYWPTALGDAEELVRRCQGCQYFAKQQHVPAYKLVTILPTWPFACWGLDMIGPLPTAPSGFNRVLVAIDKFTKWIEVKPVTCPKADRVLNFLDELVHRYGLPHRIITDLGSNFNNHQFWEYCENSGIDVRYVSVAHPQANGQVKRANGMVLDALKKRLHDAANTKGGKWIKELPNALWGCVLNLPSQQDNPRTSWSTAPKQSSLLMSCGIHQQSSNTTKASLKIADELTSTDSKKLTAPPSSNQLGTSRVSDATTIAT
jgi:hypothetical protein